MFLLADDHNVIRHGVKKSLAVCFPDAIFNEASNAAEVLLHINTNRYDLVILDISMPGRNGLEVLKEIKSSQPETPVIIFSMYPEDQFGVRSIKNGASAYLTKDIPLQELVKAIKRILKGERYLTPSLMELIANDLQRGHDLCAHQTLSDREYQVLMLIASGKNVSTIARDLSLSVKTISVYRSNIIKKMNLKNNGEITHYAFKHDLVQ
jgi:DNA-binding NarL/FixJ family response regulator